jgi:hypothetical protein
MQEMTPGRTYALLFGVVLVAAGTLGASPAEPLPRAQRV